jgi:methylglyoxal synthase
VERLAISALREAKDAISEHTFIADEVTCEERRDPYYDLRERVDVDRRILQAFDVDLDRGHIVIGIYLFNFGVLVTRSNLLDRKRFTEEGDMEYPVLPIEPRKRIALVAHDNKKGDLLEWAKFNEAALAQHIVYATGTTGRLLERELHIDIMTLQSGPLGGDQQIGAKIAEGEINFVIFFWDPLEPQPHDVDVKALLRIAVVWNVPIACNRATADFMFSSDLMNERYERILPDYQEHKERAIATLARVESPTLDATSPDSGE